MENKTSGVFYIKFIPIKHFIEKTLKINKLLFNLRNVKGTRNMKKGQS